MTTHSPGLPLWKVAAILIPAALLIGLIGWRVTSAASGPQRPDLPVHAGMYDLRAELQKGGHTAPAGPAPAGPAPNRSAL